MKKKDLEFFSHHLNQWMEELLNHADDTVEGLLEAREQLPEHWTGPLLSRTETGRFEFGTERAC